MSSNDPRKKNAPADPASLSIGITAGKTPTGDHVVLIVSQQGSIATSLQFPTPEDVSESVAIADYFYKELIGAFAESGKARLAERRKANGESDE